MDDDGDIIVIGQSMEDSTYSYLAVKYVEKDIIIPPDSENISSSISYIENRDQLIDVNGDSIPEIKYYSKGGSSNLFLKDDKIIYVFAKLYR